MVPNSDVDIYPSFPNTLVLEGKHQSSEDGSGIRSAVYLPSRHFYVALCILEKTKGFPHVLSLELFIAFGRRS
jgi:hypothetical protein